MPDEDFGQPRKTKYRMSCDICHAAKIKCGSLKPPCRRCSIKKLECVYSVSHRKGRPREKRKSVDDGKRDTPDNQSSEPTQLSDMWTPPEMDSDAAVSSGSRLDSTLLPSAGILEFDPLSGSLDLEEGFDFSSALESSSKTASLDEGLVFPPSQEERGGLLSPDILRSGQQDLLSLFHPQSLLQRNELVHSSPRPLPPQSDQFSTTRLSPILENMPPICQFLDDDFGFSKNGAFDAFNDEHIGRDSVSRRTTFSDHGDGFLSLCGDLVQRDSSGPSCDCFPVLLRRLRTLKFKQRSKEAVPIDSVLVMEAEINECFSSLQRCKTCFQDNMTYLFAMAGVRIVLDLIQKTIHDEFFRHGREACTYNELRGEQAHLRDQRDGSSLYIGDFRVPGGSRRRFLRKMLQARFSRFLVHLEGREGLINRLGDDCFAECASTMTRNIVRDLKTVLGRMELWGSRD
jgi:hypothetical protein